MIEFHEDLHQYVVDGIPYVSVTQILKSLNFYGDAANFFTPESALRGSYAHKVIELHIMQELDESSVDESLRGYFEAFKKFVDEAEIDLDTWTVEKPLASPTLRYAGTPDYVGMVNGKCAVIDLKTGGPSAATGVQLAAYQILLQENRDKSWWPVTHRFALHVSSDGKYKLIEYKDRQDAQIFKAALAVYHWQKGR